MQDPATEISQCASLADKIINQKVILTGRNISFKGRLLGQAREPVRFCMTDDIRLDNLVLDLPTETGPEQFGHRLRYRIDTFSLERMSRNKSYLTLTHRIPKFLNLRQTVVI